MLESVTNKFVFIKNLPKLDSVLYCSVYFGSVSIGYKIYLFHEVNEGYGFKDEKEIMIFSYDDEKRAWTHETNLLPDSYKQLSFVTMTKK